MGRRTRKRKPLHRKRTLHRNMRGGRLDMKTLLQATVLFAKKNGIEYGVPVVATAPTSQSKSTNKDFESKQTEYYTQYYALLKMSMDYADIVEINKVNFVSTPGFAENIVVPFNELFHKVESGGSITKVDFTIDIDVIFKEDKQTSTQRNLAKSIKDNLISNNFQKVVDDCATLKPSVPENFKLVIDTISVLASVAEFIKTHPIDQKLLSKAKKTYSQPIGNSAGNATDITKQIDNLNKLYAELTTLGKEVNVLKLSLIHI